MLTKENFRLAKQMGYRMVFLVGDPAYYPRFGFQSTVKFGLKDTHDIPDEYVMVCELVKNTLDGISETIYLE